MAHLCSVVKEHHRRLAHTSREVEVLGERLLARVAPVVTGHFLCRFFVPEGTVGRDDDCTRRTGGASSQIGPIFGLIWQ